MQSTGPASMFLRAARVTSFMMLAGPVLAACAQGAQAYGDAGVLGTGTGTVGSGGTGGSSGTGGTSTPDAGGPVFVGGGGGGGGGGGSSCGALASCGGACVDLTSNPSNCGSCGNVCATGVCAGATCSSASGGGGGTGCPAGATSCSGICTDTTSDPNNCGSCGNACASFSCTASVCDTSTGGGGGTGCATGQTSCSGTCTDTTSDPNNCGGCNIACQVSCTAGVCDVSSGGTGGCAHSPCATGAALANGCDASGDGVVSLVCGDYPQCCSSSWSSTCVADANNYCIDPTFGDLCIDPGC